ncbi:MAG: glycosyl hydrolase [Paucibacter sp.]|nr:glycosyl hydrolase [Roseateles sp.]
MRRFAIVFAAALLTGGAALADEDPLDLPSQPSELAPMRPITAIARAGDSVVAVGSRGHVLRSSNGGGSWTQSPLPLSSDLTAVQFVNAKTGYAVGHDGVVLRSDDGGASWRKLLDGRAANQLLLAHMRSVAEAGGETGQRLLAEAQRDADAGPDKPFLDLFFTSAEKGFVVGAYNLIFRTVDGGKSWQPWFDRTNNPKFFNLYAIRPCGDSLCIAGEAGLLLKLDGKAQRFQALASPYEGSFFGLVAAKAGLIAFGMRGHAYLSSDEGRSWQPLDTGLGASITAGDALPDGRVALVDQAGNLALSRDGGESFTRTATQPPAPLSAVAFNGSALVLGSSRGLGTLDISKIKP